jgi:predicted ATPase/DNA-binding winged helix-turn-helix (wHTH) protein
MKHNQFVFGPFHIEPGEQVLWKGHERVAVRPKSLAVLEHLVRNAGRFVTKEELLAAVWPEVHVGSAAVKTCIAEIRIALGDKAEAGRFIETAPCRGYRFIAAVEAGNLPTPLTSFVGRERELAEVKRLLAGSCLVTLEGPAGVGKTRLAIQVASDLLKETPHRVWWIDLAPLADPSHAAHTVAGTLGVRDRPGIALADTLAQACQGPRVLLVFDNCEHLVDACASLVEALLGAGPGLKILATSRQALRVGGETVWSVPPLSLPDTRAGIHDMLSHEAVRLFVDRTRQVCPSFAISDRNASAVARICRRLDGLPLAIELAAARVKVLAPEQIAARLGDVFTVLGPASRTHPARHQTLAAAFDWSYNLLSPQERLLFGRVSVFAGSFALAAVESICAGDGLDSADVLDLLARLVDHSLVKVVTGPSAEQTRYRLLHTVRQYAREKLPPDVRADLARRHAEFFLRLAEENEPQMYTAAGGVCLVRLNREYQNLRAALAWGRDDKGGHEIGLRLAAALRMLWVRRGHLGEGRSWLEDMLERGSDAPTELRAQALYAVGVTAHGQNDFEHARRRLEESVALWRDIGDRRGLGRALYGLGSVVANHFGDLEAAKRLVDEGIDLLRGTPNAWDLAHALMARARVATYQGRFADAVSAYDESVAILRAIPDPWLLSLAFGALATFATSQHQYDRAEEYWRQTLAAVQPLHDRWVASGAIVGMANLTYVRGDYVRATRLYGAAEALRETIDMDALMSWEGESKRFVNELPTALGESSISALWAEGRRLSREEALALALA